MSPTPRRELTLTLVVRVMPRAHDDDETTAGVVETATLRTLTDLGLDPISGGVGYTRS